MPRWVGRKKSNDELTEEEQTRLFGFRAAQVFDVSQTDGEPLPEFATIQGDPQGYTPRLKQFVLSQNIALEYDRRISPAKGMSSGGKITLLPDPPPAEHFAVLAHEVGHELLHRNERRSQTTHAIRETEAEAVSFVVLTGHQARSEYLQQRLHPASRRRQNDAF